MESPFPQPPNWRGFLGVELALLGCVWGGVSIPTVLRFVGSLEAIVLRYINDPILDDMCLQYTCPPVRVARGWRASPWP
jgi:hypothetical protein